MVQADRPWAWREGQGLPAQNHDQRRGTPIQATGGKEGAPLAVARRGKKTADKQTMSPMKRFSTRKMTKKENVLKREVDVYHVSDVDNTAVIHVGNRAMQIYQSLDLSDAEVGGMVFKRRVIQTAKGACLLLARWKPERHLRRTATEWSQKWFVEKQLFPPDAERFFAKLARRAQEEAEAEGGEESDSQEAA